MIAKLSYSLLHERILQENQERQRAALVDALKARATASKPADQSKDDDGTDRKPVNEAA